MPVSLPRSFPHLAAEASYGEIEIDPDEAALALQEEEPQHRQYRDLARRCQHQYRAVLGRWGVSDLADVDYAIERAGEELDSGVFFCRRLGLVGETDPALVMAIVVMRQKFAEDLGVTTMAERLLLDSAMIAFYHEIRMHELVENTEARIERTLFSGEPLRAVYRDMSPTPQFEVDDHLRHLRETLLPALERCQRMLVRSLRELRAGRQPRMAIRNEGQVNIANQQIVGGERF